MELILLTIVPPPGSGPVILTRKVTQYCHQWVTSGLPVGHQWVTSGSLVGHQRVTSALPVGYQWVTSGLPVGYQWVTSRSPVGHPRSEWDSQQYLYLGRSPLPIE